MPKNTHNKTHKERVEKFKTKKQMENKQMENQQAMPEIKNFPVWEQDAQIIVSGREWEVLFNSIMSMQESFQAINAVMSRNIMNGVIKMDFEKLNPKTLQYEKMTDEEKAPQAEEFSNAVAAIKVAAEKAQNESLQKSALRQPIVSPDGSEVVSEEKQPKKEKAKVVKMGAESVAGE